MQILFALLKEIPVLDSDGYVLIEESALPNQMPILLLNPKNLNYLVQMAKQKSREMHATIELVSVDWQAIQESTWESPSAVPDLPEWISVN